MNPKAIMRERSTKWSIDRGLPYRRRREPSFRLLSFATALAGALHLLSVPAVASEETFTFAGTDRLLSTVCGQSCVKGSFAFPGPPGSGLPHFNCTEYATNCNVPPLGGALYASSAALASGTIFPAYNDPTWSYFGCGPQAAQNVLNYYGVQMPIAEVAQHIATFGLIAGDQNQNIATFPDDLADGLQGLLNNQVSANHFSVTRRSGVDPGIEMQNSIDSGNPIILLVDGGDHYQVATGYNETQAYVIDYPTGVTTEGNQWRYQSDLGMALSTGASIFSTISFGAGGFEDYTIINISYINGSMIYDPPDSYVGATQCTVGGYDMHCCPSGYAMVGADPNNNIFSCGPIDTPGILGPPTLDTGTQRNNMHSCPPGEVMTGLRVDWNLLACQALPGGSITSEWVDSSTQNGYPMRACDRGPINTAVMTGIRVDQNLLSCAATERVH
jgi:hypothetical protein